MRQLPRRPGERGSRYLQLMGGVEEADAAEDVRTAGPPEQAVPAPSDAASPRPSRRAHGRWKLVLPTARSPRPSWSLASSTSSASWPRCVRSLPSCAPSSAADSQYAGLVAAPGILARGPWTPDQVDVRWREDHFEPPPEVARQADDAVTALRERGSPSHDGMATRLAGYDVEGDRLRLELQPSRWALRLVEGAGQDSLTALCAVRRPDGCWLAGTPRRMGGQLGRPLGARRRRGGRSRREPRAHARARARRGVEARARAAHGRGAAGPSRRPGDDGRAGDRRRGRRAAARPRARRLRLVAGRSAAVARGGRPAAEADGRLP